MEKSTKKEKNIYLEKNTYKNGSERTINNSHINKVLFFLLAGLVFIKMLVLNFLTPLIADDFTYAMSSSLIDALIDEYIQYMTWGGRSIVHFIARIFLLMPKGVFNAFNALIYTCLTLLIYKISNPKKKYNLSVYLFICFSIWLFTITYGQTVLWLTGSCNYLWGTFIILSFLLPYNMYISGKLTLDRRNNKIIGMFFLGILAGWCNENTSGGAILAVALIFVFCIIFKKKITLWMMSGLIGCIAGFLFMILAPGNYVRSQDPAFDDNRHIIEVLSGRISIYNFTIQNFFLPLIIIFAVFVIVQISHKTDWKRIYISFMYLVVSMAIVYAMVLSPYSNNGRAMFGATIFLIIACVYCISGLSLRSISYRVISTGFMFVLATQFIITFFSGYSDIRTTKLNFNKRHSYIELQISQGNLNVVVPYFTSYPQTKYNAMYGLEDLADDASHWINAPYANKYGIDSIIAIDQEAWERKLNE